VTASQIARTAGFNASLRTRGVLLSLDGTAFKFSALVEDTGLGGGEFELTQDDRMFAKVYVLATHPNLGEIKASSILIELDPTNGNKPTGREFTVTTKEPHDIKTAFNSVVTYANQSPNE
jgi:hypothetical protein